MLIQVPAVTKIVGLILCSVLMLGNAANNVVDIFSHKSKIRDLESHYEVVTPVQDGNFVMYIDKNYKLGKDGLDEFIITNDKDFGTKSWTGTKSWYIGGPRNLNDVCKKFTAKEKAIYDKYANIVSNKELYKKFIDDCKKQLK